MSDELRQTCRRLLEDGTVKVVIGYGQPTADGPVVPVFITRPEDCGQLVWNERCATNLVKYLLRKDVRSLGKPAIVVKGCDSRALVVLEKESQIQRSDVYVIGMACSGVKQATSDALQPKCEACDAHMPAGADLVIGQAENPPVAADRRYAALEALMAKSPEERLAYWKREFARCVKCYACRQVCPMCYCERCIVDKNRPTCIETSATLKGNFAWHITRAFHLAGRCVGCDQCTEACPAGIDLRLLNLSLAKAAEDDFAFRAGVDPKADPISGSYSLQDQESFIR
jgi:ferredoxin